MTKFTKIAAVAAFAFAFAFAAQATVVVPPNLMQGSMGAQVMAVQAIVGVSADGNFGPMTKAAVVAYQAAHALTADGVVGPATAAIMNATGVTYPAGCSAGTAYSTTTGLPCTTTTTTVAGCTPGAMFSSTTGNPCSGTTTTTPSGDEGELKSFDAVSADENSFSEDEEGVELFAFEMEADGSEMWVSRVDVYMDEVAGAGDSDNADDYFDTAILMVDGEEVADLDVEDFDEDDWGVVTGANGDEFRLRFDTDFTVEEGETARLSVSFDTAGTIDSGDESAQWMFDIQDDSVRAEDGAGFSDEYGPSANTEDTVNVDGPSTGDLDVSLNSANPDTQIVEVDATDDTDGVEVLAFDLEANDGDIDVETIRVIVEDVGAPVNMDSITSTLHLFMNGDEIASESLTASTGLDETVAFDVDGDVMIEDGDTAEFTVEADIQNLDGVDFDPGDGLVVSFVSVDAEDEANDNVEASGSAAGENFYFYVVAPTFAVVGTPDITKTAGDNAGAEATDDTADGVIEFKVTAFGGTIYINGDNETTDEKEGILLDNGIGGDLDVLGDYSYTVTGANVTTTNGGADNEYFTIPEGATATFTVSFHLDPAATGFFGGNVTAIQWGTALTDEDTRSASSINFGVVADDLETALVQLTDGA